MTHDLILQSPAIGWSRAEMVRRAGWRGAFGGGALSALALALAIPLDSGGLGWVSFLSLLAAFGSAALVGLSGWLGATRRAGQLTVTSTEVIVQTGDEVRRVPLGDIADGWVEDPNGIRLRLRDGTVLSAVAPDGSAAEAALRACGVSAAQRVLGVHLTSPAARTFLGVPLAVVGTTVVSIATIFLCGVIGVGVADVLKSPEVAGLGGLAIIAMMLALSVSMLLALISALWARRVTIGVDGVSIHGVLGKRFIPHAEITRVEPDILGVRLGTARGDVVLPTWKQGEPLLSVRDSTPCEGGRRQRVIFDRMHRAAALRRPGGPELAILDRGGRPLDTWRDEVRALAKGPGDYRRVQLNAHDLEEIVTDATAPAERRVAAVMALAGDDRPGARDRVRIAIDTCADDELKAALEQAAVDELEDDTLRRALRGV